MARASEKIYTLTNILTGQIFYVGRTFQPLGVRLSCHWTGHSDSGKIGQYIEELRTLEAKPIIELVDEFDGYDKLQSAKLESYWIQQFAAWGFELCNIKHVEVKSFVPQWQKKYVNGVYRSTKRVRFSEDEKILIKNLFRKGDANELAKMYEYTDVMFRAYLKLRVIPEWAKDAIMQFYIERGRLIYEWFLINITNYDTALKIA